MRNEKAAGSPRGQLSGHLCHIPLLVTRRRYLFQILIYRRDGCIAKYGNALIHRKRSPFPLFEGEGK